MNSRPVTRALRAALVFARDEPGRCDERTIEALLWGALKESPDVSEALVGQRELDFYLGMKDRADVACFPVGTSEEPVAVIEVKLRAAFHWREKPGISQLQAYARRSPDAKLILVASDKSIKEFHSRGADDEFGDSYDRWKANVVSLDSLHKILEQALIGVPEDPSAERIGRIVARQGE